jgi:hypothetical protein
MKKIFKTIAILTASVLIFQSCSSDDEATTAPVLPNFKMNGVTYELYTQDPNSFALVNFTSIPVVIGGQTYTDSSLSITGKTSDNTKIGTMTFRFMYKPSQGIAGTYNISKYEDDLDTDLIANQRIVNGWVSMATVNNIATPSSFELNGNDPVGTVQVINNGNNNYTLKFNGVFRKYNSNFQVQSTFPVQIDLSATATVTSL